MANNYKLTYFDIGGRAEQIRLLFALAKVDFEDIRLPYTPGQPGVIPPEVKSKLPYGQLPILEFDDGQILSQSASITRFLGRRFGFYGANEVESARVDEIADGLRDYLDTTKPMWTAKTDEDRAEATKAVIEGSTPKYMAIFASVLEKNGGKFLVGKSVTAADLLLYVIVTLMEGLFKVEFIKDYPAIQGICQRVVAIPQIAEYLEKKAKVAY